MKKRLARLSIGLLIGSMTWAQQASRQRSIEESSADERIHSYQKELARTPEDLRAQAGLASAYLQKLRETADPVYFEKAQKLVDKIFEKNSGDLVALRLQNEIDLQLHNFRAVAERAESMTRYAPSDAGGWGNLGDALMELGEYERAGKAYMRMLALRPGAQSYSRLAYFQFVTGHGDAAVRLMQNAVEAVGDNEESNAWCLAELGDMYVKLGRQDEAADSYHTALERFPSLHRAHAGLGRVARAKQNYAAAIVEYKQAQTVVPLVEYAAALEDLYLATGDAAKAADQRRLIDAIATLGKAANEKTNRNLALVLADHGRNLPLALSLMEAELPGRSDVYTWDAYAWVLFKAGRLQEARAASAKALSQNTPEPLFYQHAKELVWCRRWRQDDAAGAEAVFAVVVCNSGRAGCASDGQLQH